MSEKVKLPEVVGVPDKDPSEVFSVTPGGSDPLTTA